MPTRNILIYWEPWIKAKNCQYWEPNLVEMSRHLFSLPLLPESLHFFHRHSQKPSFHKLTCSVAVYLSLFLLHQYLPCSPACYSIHYEPCLSRHKTSTTTACLHCIYTAAVPTVLVHLLENIPVMLFIQHIITISYHHRSSRTILARQTPVCWLIWYRPLFLVRLRGGSLWQQYFDSLLVVMPCPMPTRRQPTKAMMRPTKKTIIITVSMHAL